MDEFIHVKDSTIRLSTIDRISIYSNGTNYSNEYIYVLEINFTNGEKQIMSTSDEKVIREEFYGLQNTLLNLGKQEEKQGQWLDAHFGNCQCSNCGAKMINVEVRE